MYDLDHDPEVPAGCRDADIEQAELEALGDLAAKRAKQGICTHGWVQGPPGKPVITCLYCGETFASDAAWHTAYKAALYGR